MHGDRDRTVDKIVDLAQELIQRKGYNKFSYNDISGVLGITKPSIHYWFPSKSDLGREVISRYRQTTQERLSEIMEKFSDPREQIEAYTGLFLELLNDDYLMCPGGMLAAESRTLPDAVREEVRGFFVDHDEWLFRLFATSRDAAPEASATTDEELRELARAIVACLEGALLMARLYAEEERFHSVAEEVIRKIETRRFSW